MLGAPSTQGFEKPFPTPIPSYLASMYVYTSTTYKMDVHPVVCCFLAHVQCVSCCVTLSPTGCKLLQGRKKQAWPWVELATSQQTLAGPREWRGPSCPFLVPSSQAGPQKGPCLPAQRPPPAGKQRLSRMWEWGHYNGSTLELTGTCNPLFYGVQRGWVTCSETQSSSTQPCSFHPAIKITVSSPSHHDLIISVPTSSPQSSLLYAAVGSLPATETDSASQSDTPEPLPPPPECNLSASVTSSEKRL